MSKSKDRQIVAAGAVVLREGPDGAQVAVVHRPRYDDWSLPKGKRLPGESSPATAVREVAEETGLDVVLDCRLDTQRYRVSQGSKEVHWWRATVRDGSVRDGSVRDGSVRDESARSAGDVVDRTPDAEVDQVRWWSAAEARDRLSHAADVWRLEQALQLPGTTAVVLVRHAKAMDRKNWSRPDPARPLTRRGRQQAEDLVPMLGAFGVRHVLSSSSVRCASTVRPFVTATGVDLQLCSRLSEEEGTDDGAGVAAVVTELVARTRTGAGPAALCGHRPVIPHMQQALGLPDRGLATAEMVVLHLTEDGEPLAQERHRPSS